MTDLNAAALGLGATALGALNGRTMQGEKLRRSAARAAISNSEIAAPWTAPIAYSNSLAVRSGDVISANGSWYVCTVAGTTSASGSGPSVTTDAKSYADGSAQFTYYGGARAIDAGDGAPTVTHVTVSPALGLAWYPVEGVDRYLKRGATPVAYSTSYWRLNSFDSKSGTTTTNGAGVAAFCDAAKVAIMIPAGSRARISVNGRYLRPGNFSNAANSWVVIDWTATSGRAPRLYEYETDISSNNFFGYLMTDATGSVWAPKPTEEVRGVFIGDSYLAGSGYGPFLAGGSLPNLIGKRLGIRDMWSMGTGGTGWLSQGASSYYTYRDRLPQAVALNPDILFTEGSVNDKGSSAGAITAEVTLTMQAARSLGYKGPIVVIGVPSIDTVTAVSPSGSGLTAAQIETALFAGVTAANDHKIFTIPIATDTFPWVLGSWNNAGLGVAGTPLNKDWWTANDAVHPADFGTANYAARIDQETRKRVLPYL